MQASARKPGGDPRLLLAIVRIALLAAPLPAIGYLFLTVLGGAIPTAIAWSTKGLMDGIASGAAMAGIVRQASILALLGVASALTPRLARHYQSLTQRAARLWMRDRLFRALNDIRDISWFENPASMDRVQLALKASTTSPEVLLGACLSALQGILVAGGLLSSLWIISPVVFLLLAAASLPMLVSQLMLSREQTRLERDTVEASRREVFYRMLITSLDAIKETRIFGLGDFFRERMNRETFSIHVQEQRVEARQLRRQALLSMLSAAIVGTCVVWSAARAADGRLSIGDLSVFITATAGVQGAVLQVATAIGDGYKSLLAFDSFRMITVAMPSHTPAPAREIQRLAGAIEVKDLWFRYADDGDWILRGVDLTIPAGGSLALVGVNGAGKSTLVKLLCGLYQPTRGSILVGGRDIRTVPAGDYQLGVGAIFQDYMCYDLTVAENIGLGDLAGLEDRQAVRMAACQAGADGFLDALPDGYDTMLSRIFFAGDAAGGRSRGVHLSGGQWQRLAVARGLMKRRSHLMILDEPSSGLDAEAEAELHNQMLRDSAGMTRLLISHRLGTVKDADTIAVLEDGRITALGDHRTLMAAGGTYHRLFTVQAAGYADAAI
ncbi:ABC transporter ATP-binding protein [Kitasatospora sp. NPDC085879]|uniref:ABC transporter ATP-binding protein n=1 Tax=Kitasatospora sp. NPDC085879 TaxID=3154769 RepID=UPI00343D2070